MDGKKESNKKLFFARSYSWLSSTSYFLVFNITAARSHNWRLLGPPARHRQSTIDNRQSTIDFFVAAALLLLLLLLLTKKEYDNCSISKQLVIIINCQL